MSGATGGVRDRAAHALPNRKRAGLTARAPSSSDDHPTPPPPTVAPRRQPRQELRPDRGRARPRSGRHGASFEHEPAKRKLLREPCGRGGRNPTPCTVAGHLHPRRPRGDDVHPTSSTERVVCARLASLDPQGCAPERTLIHDVPAGERRSRSSPPSQLTDRDRDRPRRRASVSASITFADELLDVEHGQQRVAAARRSAMTWREKIASTPMSLAIAVRIPGSSVRVDRDAPAARKSATTSTSRRSPDPPLPSASMLAAVSSRAARSAASTAPTRCRSASVRSQRADLGGLRHQHRLALDVLDDRVEVRRSRSARNG